MNRRLNPDSPNTQPASLEPRVARDQEPVNEFEAFLKSRNGLKKYLKILFFAGALLTTFPLLFIYGSRIEVYFNPVLTSVHFTSAKPSDAYVEFDVQGLKSRPCEYLGTSVLAGPRNGLLEATNITFPESPQPGMTRPTGLQSFGIWRIGPLEPKDEVFISLRHRCHTLWDLTTTLGPWGLPITFGKEETKKSSLSTNHDFLVTPQSVKEIANAR